MSAFKYLCVVKEVMCGGRIWRSVPRAKYFISPGRRQGRVPFSPMPLLRVAATMAVMLGWEDGIVVNRWLARRGFAV